MPRTANVSARVDQRVKEQAEVVLSQLGISMGTAMEMYLRQIALQRKIPFEMALPTIEPIEYSALSDEQFDALMDRAMQSYAAGKCSPLEDFETRFAKQIDR